MDPGDFSGSRISRQGSAIDSATLLGGVARAGLTMTSVSWKHLPWGRF
jgi:hypothetical protein